VTATDRTPSPADDPRRMRIVGLHHVTLISGDLARTTAFWRDIVGLTLVREATNDDDPGARHFWFGDPEGRPGTLISFLEYPNMEESRVGIGSTHHIAFSVGSAEEQVAWRDYLRSRGVPCSEVFDRGPFRSIYFRDPDGHIIEIATV
jgi:glyoxylase I family protein